MIFRGAAGFTAATQQQVQPEWAIGMTTAIFSLAGRVAVVTGGGGVLGGSIARALGRAGAKVLVLGRGLEALERTVGGIEGDGGEAAAVQGDVLDESSLGAARERVVERWGRVDILVNAAGGNVPRARSDDRPVFQVPLDAYREVIDLNLHGGVIPSLVFGELMARQRSGGIVLISSMAAYRAMTGVMATRWPRPASTTSPAGWRWRSHRSSATASASTPSRPASSSRTRTATC